MTRSILRSLALVAGTLILVGGCAGADNPAASADLDARYVKLALPAAEGARLSVSGSGTVSVVIGPEGGVIENAGHRLVFPAGAVAAPTLISMSPDARYVGVRMEPHGIVFPADRQPVLTLSYAGVNTSGISGLQIGYVDEDGTLLQVFASTSSDAERTVGTALPHFSGWLIIGESSPPSGG